MAVLIFSGGLNRTKIIRIINAAVSQSLEIAHEQCCDVNLILPTQIEDKIIIHYQQEIKHKQRVEFMFKDQDKIKIENIRINKINLSEYQPDRISVLLALFPSINQADLLCQKFCTKLPIVIAEYPVNGHQLLRCQIDYNARKICVL